MDITPLFQTMTLLFVAIAAGYGAVKWRLVDDHFLGSISKVVLNIFQPCLVLGSVLNTEHLLSNRQVLMLAGIAFLCYVVLIVLSLGVPKLFRIHDDQGLYRYMFIFSNVGFMGFPVVKSLFGESSMFYVTIFVLMFQIMVFTVGAFLMSGDRQHIRVSYAMFLKPSVTAAVLAYLLYLTGWGVPPILEQSVKYIGDLTTPISMMIIGCSLAAVPLRKVFQCPKLYALLTIKMVAIPLLGYVILRPFITNDLLLGIITVILAMPVATNSTMFSVEYGANRTLASSGVFVSTLLSLLTIPAIMWLLFAR